MEIPFRLAVVFIVIKAPAERRGHPLLGRPWAPTLVIESAAQAQQGHTHHRFRNQCEVLPSDEVVGED
jgi:hypothetical protein